MTSTRVVLATLAAAVAVVSIGACDSVPSNALQSCEAAQVTPSSVKTDILFIVDESSSMKEEQAALRAALADFVAALASSPVKDDFQIGVTTMAVDDTAGSPDGSLVGAGIMSGSSPSLTTDFETTIGSIVTPMSFWQEQPFEAMKLAIQKSAAGQPNEGFIRPGARLAIFFLSDEDDCSGAAVSPASSEGCRAAKAAGDLHPVSDYVSFLRAPIEGETKDVVVYAVAGFSPDTLALSCVDENRCSDTRCSTALDQGDRFLAFAQPFGTSGRIGSICSPTLSRSLLEFAGVIMSQTMPLEGTPADPRMLVTRVTKAATGEVVSCGTPAEAGTPEAATANAIYTPPREGSPASLTFQFECALGHGDRVDLDVVCAG